MTGNQHVSRRDVLRWGLTASAAAAAMPLLGACGSGSGGAAPAAAASSAAASGGGNLVIGAFEDGALTPFKQTILPMFEKATGTKVQFLTEPYDSFFAKAFQDEAAMFNTAVAGGDMAAIKAEFDKLGETCGGCHKVYRAK